MDSVHSSSLFTCPSQQRLLCAKVIIWVWFCPFLDDNLLLLSQRLNFKKCIHVELLSVFCFQFFTCQRQVFLLLFLNKSDLKGDGLYRVSGIWAGIQNFSSLISNQEDTMRPRIAMQTKLISINFDVFL